MLKTSLLFTLSLPFIISAAFADVLLETSPSGQRSLHHA